MVTAFCTRKAPSIRSFRAGETHGGMWGLSRRWMRTGPDSPFFRHMEQRSVYLLIIAFLALTAGYLGYRVSQQGDMIEVQTG